ncbi:MAG: xylulokinase [Ilumatobacteraceae bacterium]|nr:xylulokinase [Ilumatobacteraceae bacterium]
MTALPPDLALGVDCSTQSTKVLVVEVPSGRAVAEASARHPATTPPVSEQHPDAWWGALCRALADVPVDVRRRVVALSVAGQQHGLVVRGADRQPLRPAVLWNDTTAAPTIAELVQELGAETWARATGSVPLAAFTIAKLAHLARHEPDVVGATRWIGLPHDDLTWRLTGHHVTDRGDASGTGWFDPVANEVRVDLLEAATGDGARLAACLPLVLAHTEPAGSLTAEAAEATGLPEGVRVAAGTGDNMAAALGLGLIDGDVVISLGTSGTAYARSSTPTHDASGAVAGFASADGAYLPLVCTLNATKVTDTVATWLATDATGLSEMALAARDDPGSVSLTPYFDGERTPNLPDAMGEFHGLTNETTREQIALAAHDGVLRGLLAGVDALAAAGANTAGRRYLVGGGARSHAYQQRAVDLGGQPIIVPEIDEAVAFGAARQAVQLVAD